MPNKRRRWLIAGGALAILLLGLALCMPTLDGEFADVIERLQAAGEPVTFEEVVAPALAAEENAADEYIALCEEYYADSEGYLAEHREWWATPWSELTAEQREVVAQYVERYEPMRARVRAQIGGRQIRFDTRELAAWTRKPSANCYLSHIAYYAVQLEAARSPASADAGAHLRALQTEFALARGRVPLGEMELAFASSCSRGALVHLRDALAAGRLPAAEAHAHFEPILRRGRLADWQRAYRSERVRKLDQFACGLGLEPGRAVVDPLLKQNPLSFGERVLASRGVGAQFAVLDQLVALDTTSPRGAQADMDRLWAAYEKPSRWRRTELHDGPLVGNVVLNLIVRTDVEAHFARIALAAAAHRESHGEWPTRTEDLAPLLGGTIPLDYGDAVPTLRRDADGGITILGARPPGMEWRDEEEPPPLWRLPR